MYLDYSEYIAYGGTLTETSFNSLEFRAECIIDYVTFNRLSKDTTVSEKVKRCTYELINLLKLKIQSLSLGVDLSEDGTVSGSVSQQTNDGLSITYNTLSASEAYELSKNEVEEFTRTFLYGVTNELGQNVLYRGYYPNE